MQRRFAVAIMLPVVALAAACSSDATGPTNISLTADDSSAAVANAVADASAEDVDVMYAAEGSFAGGGAFSSMPASGALFEGMPGSTTGSDSVRFAFWAFGGNCTYDATSGRSTCPDVTKHGLTLSRSVAFYDQNGLSMAAYNDTTTASANFHVTVSGALTRGANADTVDRKRDMTVTGLIGHETSRTWNGAGSRDDHGQRTNDNRTINYAVHDTSVFANVVVDLPRETHPWPMSGTITRNVNGSATITRARGTRTITIQRVVTITFNGTRYVPMTVGTVSYTLDLRTGEATKTGT